MLIPFLKIWNRTRPRALVQNKIKLALWGCTQRSLLLYLCYVFRALINSLVCWLFCFCFCWIHSWHPGMRHGATFLGCAAATLNHTETWLIPWRQYSVDHAETWLIPWRQYSENHTMTWLIPWRWYSENHTGTSLHNDVTLISENIWNNYHGNLWHPYNKWCQSSDANINYLLNDFLLSDLFIQLCRLGR